MADKLPLILDCFRAIKIEAIWEIRGNCYQKKKDKVRTLALFSPESMLVPHKDNTAVLNKNHTFPLSFKHASFCNFAKCAAPKRAKAF